MSRINYPTPIGILVGVFIGLLLFIRGERYWPGAFTVWALMAMMWFTVGRRR